MTPSTPVALLTGASRGLGRALATTLAARGWHLVLTARDPVPLARVAAELGATALPGDVADPAHREALAAAVGDRLDLLVNNASALGPSPLPAITRYPLDSLRRVYEVNVLAPLGLLQLLHEPLRRAGGRVLDLSSDAAVEPYAGWSGYGSSKAALDALTAVAAVELPELRIYAVDPGDLRTDLHQAAFPGEDISDRPEPETAVPALLRLIEGDLPSGRYRANELVSS